MVAINYYNQCKLFAKTNNICKWLNKYYYYANVGLIGYCIYKNMALEKNGFLLTGV